MSHPIELTQKAGVGRRLAAGGPVEWPVHGLRHSPEGDTSGWFLWTGALTDEPDFFVPMHPAHLLDRIPQLAAELGAQPGSRFLIAPDHRDTWCDASLLERD